VSATIVGAGLAGLIAAHAWPQAAVLEAAPRPRPGHRALLRFRSPAVGALVGVEFRKVRVHKGLWADGAYHAPAIRWANLYAQKVLGAGHLKGDRSIWALEPVERFIAPDDFYEQLVAAVGDRVHWGVKAAYATTGPIISTAPLPTVLDAMGVTHPLQFHRSPIRVRRWRVHGADVFQTIYYPEPHLTVYRASITGETLIVECVEGKMTEADMQAIERSFGIDLNECQLLEDVEQKYGKIVPVDDTVRKQLLFQLTHEHAVYSLGRFATWRNILLDDVVDDIAAIKRLLKANSAYDVRRAAA
jgi:hypothetical protein